MLTARIVHIQANRRLVLTSVTGDKIQIHYNDHQPPTVKEAPWGGCFITFANYMVGVTEKASAVKKLLAK